MQYHAVSQSARWVLSDPSQALSPPATAINAAVRRDSEYALARSLGNLGVSNLENHVIFGSWITIMKNIHKGAKALCNLLPVAIVVHCCYVVLWEGMNSFIGSSSLLQNSRG